MSNQLNLRFAQMLCARICHDLASPIGAIDSGIELLEEQITPEASETMDLIAYSTSVASKRLKLLRLAFGYGSNISCLSDLQGIVENATDSAKFSIQWEGNAKVQFDPGTAKAWGQLIVNLLILAMDAAPRGGHIKVRGPELETAQASVVLEADMIAFADELKQAAVSSGSDPSTWRPRNIQAVLSSVLATSLNHQIGITQENNRLRLDIQEI